MGMNLAHGGHLTHGSPVNMSGLIYNFVPYGVGDDGFIDYDAFEAKVREVKPKLVVAGASAYPRVIDFERMSKVVKEVGAIFMVDMAHIAGLCARGTASLARAVCGCRDHHDPQDPPRTARRSHPLP